MPDPDPRKYGETDSPLEDDLEAAFGRQLSEGVQRLHRRWHVLLATGFTGGTEIAIGVMAMLLVYHETGSHLLAGLAFSIGFLALLLGRAELFTEGFLIPVMTVVARRASYSQLMRLWGGTLVSNLVGGWLIMWLVMTAFPQQQADTVEMAGHFAGEPLTLRTFSLAVLAGMVITLMTRMQHGTDSMPAKIAAAVAAGFLLASSQMFHSILDSLLIFGALHTGQAPFGYGEWAYWFAYTVVGNMVGGLGLVALVRFVRSRERLLDERRAVDREG
ncbi:formate/nitrite transporter FocA (FNT family) [Georgenia soli]|uniref:Formate/nitrite transporter FocA (FNT family) n=1 Tax=Georgenia soli TaxID=638953 RepID=A0A2A9EMT2_9MICO|nr:formate/nitrite transporter family protein [Georgenia soli]PFG39831.1 formate/nitrite transporter FocA (FNT family) [Georgenia soli]